MASEESQDLSPLLESYSGPGSVFQRFEARAMGTLNVLLLAGACEEDLRKGAQAAFDCLTRLEQSLSKFLPDSDVSLLNGLGASRPVAVGEDLHRLLVKAREAWEITGGAFDPTVGTLLDAWGLVDMEGRIPEAREIEDLLSRQGMQHVLIDEHSSRVRFDAPGVSLDFGGIAKGYAVDRSAALLQKHGVATGAVISGRSSVVTWGAPPGDERWRFEIVHPTRPGDVYRTALVEEGAVSSSGSSERRFFRGGREYGHLLDPRTGRQARGLRGVTVWTESALLGDVLSTSLFVLGKDALVSGGVVETLVRRWHEGEGEGEPRASVVLLEENTGVWGGLDLLVHHVGRPALEIVEA